MTIFLSKKAKALKQERET